MKVIRSRFDDLFTLFNNGVSGEFQQKLLRADVLKIDRRLRVFAGALNHDHFADAKTLVFDDIADFQRTGRC